MSHAVWDRFEPAEQEARNSAATASLTLGLMSLVLSVLTGIPAVIIGLVGVVRARSRGTGAVKSVVGVVLGLASMALLLAAVAYVRPMWTTVQSVRAYQDQGLPATDSPQARQGIEQGREALQQMGVDTAASLSCQDPQVFGTEVRVACTGTTQTGEPATIEGTCPATQLLGGSATCQAMVNGAPTNVRVTLVDGMPIVEIP